jgi:hypothetical protein
MKVIIISDTHDNLVNFKKAINWAKVNSIKKIIHCGDICTLKVLKEAIKDFSGEIYLCMGNADLDHFEIKGESEKKFGKALIFKKEGKIKLGDKNIAFTHFPKIARKIALTGKYDIVFYGHTHKPWLEKKGNVKLVNPGNLAGLIYKASFAVYDTESESLDLKIISQI